MHLEEFKPARRTSVPGRYRTCSVYLQQYRFLRHKLQEGHAFWKRSISSLRKWKELNQRLVKTYAMMEGVGTSASWSTCTSTASTTALRQLAAFSHRIKNQYNDNYDYFYVKLADASRLIRLETGRSPLAEPHQLHWSMPIRLSKNTSSVFPATLYQNQVERPGRQPDALCQGVHQDSTNAASYACSAICGPTTSSST